jgi:hypothetical protein
MHAKSLMLLQFLPGGVQFSSKISEEIKKKSRLMATLSTA